MSVPWPFFILQMFSWDRDWLHCVNSWPDFGFAGFNDGLLGSLSSAGSSAYLVEEATAVCWNQWPHPSKRARGAWIQRCCVELSICHNGLSVARRHLQLCILGETAAVRPLEVIHALIVCCPSGKTSLGSLQTPSHVSVAQPHPWKTGGREAEITIPEPFFQSSYFAFLKFVRNLEYLGQGNLGKPYHWPAGMHGAGPALVS